MSNSSAVSPDGRRALPLLGGTLDDSLDGALDDALACCTPLAREPLTSQAAVQVVPMLRAVADPARLRLLSLVLSHEGAEACVCDLLPHFELSQPTISHHLKVLHEAGLLDREKRGTWVFYLARPEAMAALANLFTAADVTQSLVGADA